MLAVVAATTVAHTAMIMGTAVFPVVAPRLAVELGVPPALVGYQVSIVYGIAMFATALLSGFNLRFGACRMTQVCLALAALAMLLTLSANLAAIAIASILLGVGISIMTPASVHLLFRFSPPQRRNLIFSVKQTGVPLGWLLVALVAPGITVAFGWRWALAIVAIIALAMLVLLQPVRGEWDNDRNPSAAISQSVFAGFVLLWRLAVLRSLAIASFFYSFVQLCLSTFMVTMLVEETHLTLIEAGLMLSLAQASGVAGRIAWGWCADRSGNGFRLLYLLNLGMIVCCALTASITPQWPLPALALLFIAFGATTIGWNGIFLAEVARHSPPGMVGVATGGALVWNFGGILVGPALFATVCNWTGSYTTAYGWLAPIAVLGLWFIVLARRSLRGASVQPA